MALDYKASYIIKELYYKSDNSLTTEDEILDKYANPDDKYIDSNNQEQINKHLEVSDQLSNINGMHTYKLLSSKDIDFNNIYLPHSAVSPDNWGSFDINRRWGNDQYIYINDVYELMNVIDYLLCACQDLYSEINKNKYGEGDDVEIWFLENIINNEKLLPVYKLFKDDFSKTSDKNIYTELNPFAYSTILNPNKLSNFGFCTQFSLINESSSSDIFKISRILNTLINRNGAKGYIKELQEAQYMSSGVMNVNGTNVNIYGYKIDGDLHLYPGFNIDNFIVTNNIIQNPIEIIDISNQKLKYSTCYFKNSENNYAYERIYCEFIKNSYILYYIDRNNKKNIIYFGTNSNDYKQTFINANIEYTIHTWTEQDEAIGNNIGYYDQSNQLFIPYIYVLKDEFSVSLQIATPKTEKYQLAQNSIEILYYKAKNNLLQSNVYVLANNNDYVLNSKTIDSSQTNFTDKYRYNVPENSNIKFEINATYLNDGSTQYNNAAEDEYIDVIVYQTDANNITEQQYANMNKYYKFEYVDSNSFKRIFTELDFNGFRSFISTNTNVLFEGNNKFFHLYIKNNNPYVLKGKLSYHYLINQNVDYNKVKACVSYINNNNLFIKSQYNSYTLSYILPNDIEQIKFNVDVEIEETSKATGINHTFPINLNKIHNPKIHYSNDYDYNNELTTYFENIHMYSIWSQNNAKYYDNEHGPTPQPTDTENDYVLAFQSQIYGSENNNPIILTKQTNGNIYHYTHDKSNAKELLKDIKDYSIYYNNSNVDNYKDIVKIMYGDNNNYTNNELSSNANVNNEKIIDIIYNPVNNYVNLLGAKETIKYLNIYGSENDNKLAIINVTDYNNHLTQFTHESNLKVSYYPLFNIYNIGQNYRLNGTSNVIDIYNGKTPNSVNLNTLNSLSSYYDVFIVKDNNNMFMNYLQFKFIGLNNNNIKYYTQYNKSDVHNYINTEDYNNNSYMIIDANQFEIVKKSVNITVPGGTNPNNWQFTTYNVPISYMIIKDTTFKIINDNTTQPTTNTHQYDLNNSSDRLNYKRYVNSWKDDNVGNYNPITLYLKLSANLTNKTPFFNESNEAIMKFNIKRMKAQQFSIGGRSQESVPDYVAINTKHYLSDIISIYDAQNIDSSSGSYLEWNNTTQTYDVKDIPLEKSVTHNYIYTDSNKFYIEGITKTNNNYNYDIVKVSKINKININLDNINSLPSWLNIDTETFTFTINYNNDLETYLQQNGLNNIINLQIPITQLFGNKKCMTEQGGTSPNIYLSIIYRTSQNTGIYQTITISGNTYELFEYKDNINKNYREQLIDFITQNN